MQGTTETWIIKAHYEDANLSYEGYPERGIPAEGMYGIHSYRLVFN